jgi:hypothetical protein
MACHGMPILSDQDTTLPFCPQQNFGVVAPQWQVKGIADAGNVQWQPALHAIASLDGVPKRAAEMLVEQESKRHDSRALDFAEHVCSAECFQALPQCFHVNCVRVGYALTSQFRSTTNCVIIYFRVIFKIKGDDFVDQRQWQCWILPCQHLRRKTFIVVMHQVQ